MPSEARAALIVNPTSGGGRGWRVVGQAAPLLRRAGVLPEVVMCTNGDEPGALARQAAEAGHRLVVAVGGDGQAAAVAAGLVGTDVALAVLPAGSANDYARTLGMPRGNVAAAVDVIAAGRTARVDTVKVRLADRERHFLNVVGTGFDAAVAARAERIPMFRGAGRYVLAIMAELPRFRAATITLDVDGATRELRAMMVAIANGVSYGGGMRVAPSAMLDSGQLEVCVVGEVSKADFLRAFPRVFRGTHVTHRAVTMLSGRQIRLAADRPLRLIGDGEWFGELPATVAVVPASLRVVVGPGYRGVAVSGSE
jgi:diacylglycerol kinase (ATP)